MGSLVGASHQQKRFPLYCADGTVTTGGTPQLVLPQMAFRSLLILQNTSSAALVFEFGSARATATITSGVVTSITVTNAGFNFTKPPVVTFYGGGKAGNGSYLGLNQYGGESPNASLGAGRPAKAHAVLTTGAVSSIVIDDGGAGYAIAPAVILTNSDLDPYGCALPSATVGMILPNGVLPLQLDGTSCHTDPISVYGGTTGQAFLCRWMA